MFDIGLTKRKNFVQVSLAKYAFADVDCSWEIDVVDI